MKVIIYNKKYFEKSINKMPEDMALKVLKKIESLKNFPNLDYEVKKLRNLDVADFRIRVGDYRVLFCFHKKEKEIIIMDVLHRKDAYKG